MEKRETNLTLPTWLTAENHDNIKTDPHRNYIQINIRGVIRLLNFLTNTNVSYSSKKSPWIRLLSLITYTIMILKGTSLTYLWIVGLLLFIKLSVLPGSVIINIIKKLFRLLIISAIVLLPSIVISQNDMTLFLQLLGKELKPKALRSAFGSRRSGTGRSGGSWGRPGGRRRGPRWTPLPPVCGRIRTISPAWTASSTFWRRWAIPPSHATISDKKGAVSLKK